MQKPDHIAQTCGNALRVLPESHVMQKQASPNCGHIIGNRKRWRKRKNRPEGRFFEISRTICHRPLEGRMARVTGLEPATSGVTGRHSNRLSYTRVVVRAAL
ncbi:hypothetical protein MTBLM5_200023 [Magnetospirillum sp. LM-5]|nr:hypothetical protein MTBLM5_200023 [Magnetospirillum sp. LM-5]